MKINDRKLEEIIIAKHTRNRYTLATITVALSEITKHCRHSTSTPLIYKRLVILIHSLVNLL